jgi:hypothetical protein
MNKKADGNFFYIKDSHQRTNKIGEKTYKEDELKILGDQIYNAFGAKTLNSKLIEIDGNELYASDSFLHSSFYNPDIENKGVTFRLYYLPNQRTSLYFFFRKLIAEGRFSQPEEILKGMLMDLVVGNQNRHYSEVIIKEEISSGRLSLIAFIDNEIFPDTNTSTPKTFLTKNSKGTYEDSILSEAKAISKWIDFNIKEFLVKSKEIKHFFNPEQLEVYQLIAHSLDSIIYKLG